MTKMSDAWGNIEDKAKRVSKTYRMPDDTLIKMKFIKGRLQEKTGLKVSFTDVLIWCVDHGVDHIDVWEVKKNV